MNRNSSGLGWLYKHTIRFRQLLQTTHWLAYKQQNFISPCSVAWKSNIKMLQGQVLERILLCDADCQTCLVSLGGGEQREKTGALVTFIRTLILFI